MATDPQILLEATGKVLEIVPEAYADVAQPAARQTGSLLARIPRAINAALSPIDIWIERREYAVEETKKLLAFKLQNIEPEKIVPPDPYVAIPAIQAISYSMDSEELREMYANLLSKAMNTDYKVDVHPSFVEAIKQMNPIDAENLILFKHSDLPIAEYQYKVKGSTGNVSLLKNIFLSNADRSNINAQAVSLSALQRLGLIEIIYDVWIMDEGAYEPFSETSEYKFYQEVLTQEAITDKYEKLNIRKGYAKSTPYGNAFIKICVD